MSSPRGTSGSAATRQIGPFLVPASIQKTSNRAGKPLGTLLSPMKDMASRRRRLHCAASTPMHHLYSDVRREHHPVKDKALCVNPMRRRDEALTDGLEDDDAEGRDGSS